MGLELLVCQDAQMITLDELKVRAELGVMARGVLLSEKENHTPASSPHL